MGPRERDGNRQEADPSFSLLPHRTVVHSKRLWLTHGARAYRGLAIFIPLFESRNGVQNLLNSADRSIVDAGVERRKGARRPTPQRENPFHSGKVMRETQGLSRPSWGAIVP